MRVTRAVLGVLVMVAVLTLGPSFAVASGSSGKGSGPVVGAAELDRRVG